MIGIKGVGMTMLAQYFAENGIEVSGSDVVEKFMTDKVLSDSGVKLSENFSETNMPNDAQLIIYSTAYGPDSNIEVKKALNGKIKVLTYAQALGEVFNQKHGISVIGSHGKTTTTAWLGFVMEKAGLSPSVMVGANVPQFNGTSLVGKSDYLVIEADEYQNKLQYFQPKAVLLNNIDYDHPDFFPSKDDYLNVFVEYIKKIPAKGFLVANFDDPNIRKIANVNCRGKVISYAINESADFVAYDIKSENSKQYFKVKLGVDESDEDEEVLANDLGDFSISLSGRHNIYNSLAIIATCVELNIELVKIRKYLEEFTGTSRRMQIMGEYRGATVIDDYAHHPSEIKATLEAARQKFGNKKLRVVFHPHTYSRTLALLDDFATSFELADELVILDIYGSAREKQGGVHSNDLIEKILEYNRSKNKSQDVKYIPDLTGCEKYFKESAERGEIILLMGAGDVFRVGENLLK